MSDKDAVVIEPVVSDNWAADVGVALPWTPSGDRWYRYATWLTDVDTSGNPLPPGERRFVAVDQYERTLRPQLLDRYVANGFCWLVVGSLQAGRAFAQPQDAPSAVAYYAALANRARLVYHITPFSRGAHPVPFSFDWSIDYFPRQYRRPGPEMTHRLWLVGAGAPGSRPSLRTRRPTRPRSRCSCCSPRSSRCRPRMGLSTSPTRRR